MPCRERLRVEGVSLFGLWAVPDHTLFKDSIIRLYLPNEALPLHQLSAGVWLC